MALTADLCFGTEEVGVADVKKFVDVCALAEAILDEAKSIPDGLNKLEDLRAQGDAVNAALAKFGFPKIAVHAAALKFSEDIVGRALEIKKEACGLAPTGDVPGSQNDFQVSE